jgi:hypothetical protein
MISTALTVFISLTLGSFVLCGSLYCLSYIRETMSGRLDSESADSDEEDLERTDSEEVDLLVDIIGAENM